jgi:hypothetical protein
MFSSSGVTRLQHIVATALESGRDCQSLALPQTDCNHLCFRVAPSPTGDP